jgi:dUTP pyrophosphatase
LTNINVNIKRLHPDAVIPKYAKPGDAGFDLVAIGDVIIEPGETALVKTGLAFEISEGYELQIRPRSGVSLKTKLRVQLGTVDSGYRGEIGVIVDNIACSTYEYENYGDGPVVEIVRHNALHTIDGTGDSPLGNVLTEHTYPVGTYIIRKNDRIAQGVLSAGPTATFTEVDSLDETERGDGGFGSTGTDVVVKEAE